MFRLLTLQQFTTRLKGSRTHPVVCTLMLLDEYHFELDYTYSGKRIRLLQGRHRYSESIIEDHTSLNSE